MLSRHWGAGWSQKRWICWCTCPETCRHTLKCVFINRLLGIYWIISLLWIQIRFSFDCVLQSAIGLANFVLTFILFALPEFFFRFKRVSWRLRHLLYLSYVQYSVFDCSLKAFCTWAYIYSQLWNKCLIFLFQINPKPFDWDVFMWTSMGLSNTHWHKMKLSLLIFH